MSIIANQISDSDIDLKHYFENLPEFQFLDVGVLDAKYLHHHDDSLDYLAFLKNQLEASKSMIFKSLISIESYKTRIKSELVVTLAGVLKQY